MLRSAALQTVFRVARVMLLGIIMSLGLFSLLFWLQPSQFEPEKKSDFMQDYLAVKAIADGENPYLPMNQLGPRFGIGIKLPDVPTPHRPTFEVMIGPLAWFSCRTAAILWFLTSFLSLLVSLRVLFGLRGINLGMGLLMAVIWFPIQADLAIGQVMCVTLAPLTFSWRFIRTRHILAGIGNRMR